MKEKAKIWIVVALVMINIGLVLSCIKLRNERDNYYAEIMERAVEHEELKVQLYAEVDARLKVQYENERLWEMYYSTVSEYQGEYEYYE